MSLKILFACNMNSVRSPMAAALLRLGGEGELAVDSAGVYEGGLDPFVEQVMGECGVSMENHEPKTLKDVEIEKFDAIIALTPEAAIAARNLSPNQPIEYWDIENPSDERGGRDAVIAAYRRVRDELSAQLAARFPDFYEKP